MTPLPNIPPGKGPVLLSRDTLAKLMRSLRERTPIPSRSPVFRQGANGFTVPLPDVVSAASRLPLEVYLRGGLLAVAAGTVNGHVPSGSIGGTLLDDEIVELAADLSEPWWVYVEASYTLTIRDGWVESGLVTASEVVLSTTANAHLGVQAANKQLVPLGLRRTDGTLGVLSRGNLWLWFSDDGTATSTPEIAVTGLSALSLS